MITRKTGLVIAATAALFGLLATTAPAGVAGVKIPVPAAPAAPTLEAALAAKGLAPGATPKGSHRKTTIPAGHAMPLHGKEEDGPDELPAKGAKVQTLQQAYNKHFKNPTPATKSRSTAGATAPVAKPTAVLTAAATCDPTAANRITCENSLPGNPPSEWDLPSADGGDPSLQGFATDISVNVGGTVHYKISSTTTAYRVDVYRLGWYQGNGARKVASFSPQSPQTQPACLSDAATGLVDCGNWSESASWAVPSTAVSGVYVARLTRLDNGGASHIVFVVRDDASHSDLLFKTSDTTWVAYNTYGGNSLYTGNGPFGGGRAAAVSYNRPVITRQVEGTRSWVFNDEIPAIRFLERNGYDISYTSSVDTARQGNLILNHKALLSVGHDEYWSSEMRTSVESARDAGVNIVFLTGNEVYWKTRWEPSHDGTNTPWRTVVCYKDTKNPTPIDPQYPASWTGTWRDPRYSPPADGGKPENALSGTMYQVDPPTDFALDISSQYSKLRIWRNTPVATLQPGQHRTLAPATLGYEFDIDADNGFRPAGLFDVSGQVENVQAKLQDYGAVVAPGTVTHSMTMYRASSGALVFSAGTIQFTWGLDDTHDGSPPSNADPVMQQIVVNLLADMKAQPATLMAGLTAATASTDKTAPTSTITSTGNPVVASPYTVTGTAADTGGGVVAGVEVSADGTTWHPATGTTSWSYSFTPSSPGPFTLKVRAADDSGNIQTPLSASLTTVRRVCPCNIFGNRVPQVPSSSDGSSLELGMRFQSNINGSVTGVRFYKGALNTGIHTGSLWTASGSLLATGTFTNETTTGWQSLTFPSPVAINAAVPYVISYHTATGFYSADTFFFGNSSTYSAPLLAPASTGSAPNGVFHQGATGFPSDSFQSTNYYVDPIVSADTSTDVGAPSITATTPINGASSVPVGTQPTASFSKPFAPGSVTFGLSTAGQTVASTFVADSIRLTATLSPSQPLAPATTYTATIAATDTLGTPMATPYSWSFTTGSAQLPPGNCPCTLWGDQQQPSTVTTADVGAVELGVKIQPSSNGWISGVRFFKGPSNTGTHYGELWSTTGTKLASAVFGTESITGWQEVSFASPVQVAAGTTYIASYHTDRGFYSSTTGYFSSSGASYGPLSAPSSPASGGNGVEAYGPVGTFPSGTSQATNYWVDAVFSVTQPPATPPRVLTVTPANGDIGAALMATPSVTFDRSVTNIQLAVTSAAGPVAGQTSYDDTAHLATFTPAGPLAVGTSYSASVSASGTDGTAMAKPFLWGFSTGIPATCPCTLFSNAQQPAVASGNDTAAYELGVRFVSDVSGFVTGVRFYKGTGNTGTHTGSLWTATGQLLATGTFSGESLAGWQTLTFDGPVAIAANTSYIASYHTSAGHYSYDNNGFAADTNRPPLHAFASTTRAPNGVFIGGTSAFPTATYGATNYWVDPLFATTATDTSPPQVVNTSPGSGAVGVPTSSTITATFSEPIALATASLSLSSASGPVTGTTSLDPTGKILTFTPGTALVAGGQYTARVAASDLAGNAMPAFSWSFTTIAVASCPCSLLGAALPAVADSGEAASIELGLKFTSDVAGRVTGVRFYKSAANTGVHTGSLWDASGALLATGTFAGETAVGWQTLTFSSPVTISAGQAYVVSYHTTIGHYSYSGAYFAQPKDVPPLHAPVGNGLYAYGATRAPTSSYNSTNYWVDVIVASP